LADVDHRSTLPRVSPDRFARRVFTGAGVYGIVCLAPMYGVERLVGEMEPPPITHPEFFYGFVGLALSWQLAFLVIGRDPVRYRALMLPSIVEKVTWFVAVIVLVALGRTRATLLPFAIVDLGLAALFLVAHRRTASN
jgi:hypothetical protein